MQVVQHLPHPRPHPLLLFRRPSGLRPLQPAAEGSKIEGTPAGFRIHRQHLGHVLGELLQPLAGPGRAEGPLEALPGGDGELEGLQGGVGVGAVPAEPTVHKALVGGAHVGGIQGAAVPKAQQGVSSRGGNRPPQRLILRARRASLPPTPPGVAPQALELRVLPPLLLRPGEFRKLRRPGADQGQCLAVAGGHVCVRALGAAEEDVLEVGEAHAGVGQGPVRLVALVESALTADLVLFIHQLPLIRILFVARRPLRAVQQGSIQASLTLPAPNWLQWGGPVHGGLQRHFNGVGGYEPGQDGEEEDEDDRAAKFACGQARVTHSHYDGLLGEQEDLHNP
mmetsp:Transcript_8334/g.20550  ORF Transcript_8334/g.20550 Transcript_8334/m.20550 type:complete len:338 (+) Transcript_8334:5617-6630(+)